MKIDSPIKKIPLNRMMIENPNYSQNTSLTNSWSWIISIYTILGFICVLWLDNPGKK